jgi:hypothetical protein
MTQASPDVFTHANALAVLLTTEALVFTAISVSLTFSNVSHHVPNLPLKPHQLGYVAAVLIGGLAVGALTAWWSVFASPWSCHFTKVVEGLAILLGIVAQPLMAWALARGLRARQ